MTISYLICLLTMHWVVKFHFPITWAIKQVFFSFWLYVVSLLRFLVYIIDHHCIMENLKKSVENKNKLRTIYPNNKEDFKNSKPYGPILLVLIKQRVYASQIVLSLAIKWIHLSDWQILITLKIFTIFAWKLKTYFSLQ